MCVLDKGLNLEAGISQHILGLDTICPSHLGKQGQNSLLREVIDRGEATSLDASLYHSDLQGDNCHCIIAVDRGNKPSALSLYGAE